MEPSSDSGEDPATVVEPSSSGQSAAGEKTEEHDYILAKVRGRLFSHKSVAFKIGRFVVLDEIGSGAMGTVYAAYDEVLDRKVAIKVLHDADLPGEEERLRFLREAQALARLSHPNVVAVHEVGDGEEPMYLAMEFVRGKNLAAWLKDEPEPQDVLEALVQACRGLIAAHGAGLVHRDFKPHNVMRSDDGTVKVLDFGLARVVTAAESTDLELPAASRRGSGSVSGSGSLTVPGTVMGTPAYMSPEQHLGHEVGERSDQYSFCVSAWECLTGERPFGERNYEALVRAKHAGPPSWPISAASVPRRVTQALSRGLAPDPADRWPSMELLAEALSPQPRRSGSRWSLVLVGAGALGVGAGAVALQGSRDAEPTPCTEAAEQLAGIWDEARSQEVEAAIVAIDRPYAADTWARTERALDDYASEWVSTHTDACEATAVRGEQSPVMLDLRMACLKRASGELRATVDALADADAELVQRADALTSGLPPLPRCSDADALSAEVQPPEPSEAEAVAVARGTLARARSLDRGGRYAAALEAAELAEAQLVGVGYGPIQTEVSLVRGIALQHLSEFEASEAALIDALERAARYDQRESLGFVATRLVEVVGVGQRRTDDGLRYRPLAAGLSADEPLARAELGSTIAKILRGRGDFVEAEAEVRAALTFLEQVPGPHPLREASLRSALGTILSSQGKSAEAAKESLASLTLKADTLGSEHPRVAQAHNLYGTILGRQGKFEEAEAEFRTALSGYEASLGSAHVHAAKVRVDLATILSQKGREAEAEALFRAAIPALEEGYGAEHPVVGTARLNLATTLFRQGKLEDAESTIRVALVQLEAREGPTHLHVLGGRMHLANILALQEKFEDAEAEFRRSISGMETSLGHEHPNLALARGNLAMLLEGQGRLGDARPFAEAAWDRQQRDDVAGPPKAEAAFTLARILWGVEPPHRDRSRARALAEQAVQLRRGFDPDGADTKALEQWLDGHQRT